MQQLGFGFEIYDKTGARPAFLYEDDEVLAALDVIQGAMWVSTDMESTGLTDASAPIDLDKPAIKSGAFNKVRMRTIQARVPTILGRSGPRKDFAFDLDRMSPGMAARVARTILERPMVIAHNAGFDLYWLRLAEGRTTMPKMVVDSMLMTRLLDPQHSLLRAHIIDHITSSADPKWSLTEATPVEKAAWKSLISEASGGSLADISLVYFNEVLDKTYQKPHNWAGLLGFEHYDYAIDDVVLADRIMAKLLGVPEDGDLYRAYLLLRARSHTVRLVEPQVPELVMLRENGMPINKDVGRRYAKLKHRELADMVNALIEVEPKLERFRSTLSNPDAGLDNALKQALATAFEERGVMLRHTVATHAAQVGEKDLRACKAAQIPEAQPLFKAWVAVCRAKKTRNMALDVLGYAERSVDGCLRSLLSHGPVTGRLSASEPNCQQWPRDQLFRAMCMSEIIPGGETFTWVATVASAGFCALALEELVLPGQTVELPTAWAAALHAAGKGMKDWSSEERKAFEDTLFSKFERLIVASDFGALDVRVGAALAVRAQRQMLDLARGHAVPGLVQPSEEIAAVVRRVAGISLKYDFEEAEPRLWEMHREYDVDARMLVKRMNDLSVQFENKEIQRRDYFRQRSALKRRLSCVQLGRRLAQCLALGAPRHELEYSALRDAFVADIDIHTFTGMKLAGRDPMKEFEGLTQAARKKLEKDLKAELGPRRQQGKIANLSLLYGMADAGFQEAAARGYDEHWSLEEAGAIRSLWMDAYPEVELWHLWTDALQCGTVYLPEQGKDRPVRTSWTLVSTLAGREIVAYGLNAALSYQDQSTGADILGMIMHRLKEDYPHIFQWAINQVHDELVFAWPKEHHGEYLPIVEGVMVGEANKLTMQYGVPCAVSPACGVLWIKD